MYTVATTGCIQWPRQAIYTAKNANDKELLTCILTCELGLYKQSTSFVKASWLYITNDLEISDITAHNS